MVRGEVEARISREIGLYLRRARGAQGWSLFDLCERVTKLGFDLTESSLSRMERGKAVLGTPIMSAIAMSLGTSLGELDQIIRRAHLAEDTDLSGRSFESLCKEGRLVARSGRAIKALQLFTAAHDWLWMQEPPATGDERFPFVLVRLADLYARIRSFGLASDHALRVLNLDSASISQKAAAARTLIRVGRLSGDFYSTQLYGKELVRMLDKLDPKAQAEALTTLGGLHESAGEYAQAAERYEAALSLLRKQGLPEDAMKVKASLGFVLHCAGATTGGTRLVREALDEARRSEFPDAIHNALRHLGIMCLRQKNYDSASTHLEEAASVARRMGSPALEFEVWHLLWCNFESLSKNVSFERRRLGRRLTSLAKGLDPTIPEVRQYHASVSLKGLGRRKNEDPAK